MSKSRINIVTAEQIQSFLDKMDSGKGLQNKRVRLTKVTHDVETPNPNGIDAGYVFEGTLTLEPTLGFSVIVSQQDGRYLQTSCVTEIIDDLNFKTMNSTYKLELIEE